MRNIPVAMEGEAPSDMPRVSVIMNCLNCEKYLEEALQSVRRQTFSDWEIVFWDNASTDRSGEIARGSDRRMRYFCGDHTVSLGQARNHALAEARGEFIAFLDSDDIWQADKLEKQLALFKGRPEVGLVFSDCIDFDEHGVEYRRFKIEKPPRGDVFRHLLTDYFLPLVTVVVRRSVLDGLGELFDPRFSVMEEADLFVRVAKECEVDFVDEPLARYRIHATNLSKRGRHLHGAEWDLFILRLCEKYDGFEIEFAAELAHMREVAQYKHALVEWEAGDGRAARRRIRGCPPSLRNRVTYFLTFLPFVAYDWVAGLRRRYRTLR